MAAALIDRVARRPEGGIGEGAHGDGDNFGCSSGVPVNSRTADRTEAEVQRRTAVAKPGIDVKPPFDAHPVPGKARLCPEHAAGAALAFQAMADRHAHRIALASDAKLTATASGVADGHAFTLNASVAGDNIERRKYARVYRSTPLS